MDSMEDISNEAPAFPGFASALHERPSVLPWLSLLSSIYERFSRDIGEASVVLRLHCRCDML